jgi:hypothetical protein
MPRLAFKVFVIGFNKCGTRSLHRYFSECGLDSCHGGAQSIDLSVRVLRNIVLGVPALQGLDHFDAYADIAAVQSQFRQFDCDYPGSRFIFNVRDIDRWILSRLNHLNGRNCEFLNLLYGLNLDWQEWVTRWRTEFAAHELAVAEHFKHRPADLLRYDIEKDEPSRLAMFLGISGAAPDRALPQDGTTKAKHYVLDGKRFVKRSA